MTFHHIYPMFFLFSIPEDIRTLEDIDIDIFCSYEQKKQHRISSHMLCLVYFLCYNTWYHHIGFPFKMPAISVWADIGTIVLGHSVLISLIDMQVAKDPSGKDINALQQHIKNLLSPSTPFFFNTLYDPYREGADFVRGYPFSLREGVPTAVSHGLWLNIPDYDAPTQLVKPLERNTRFNSNPN